MAFKIAHQRFILRLLYSSKPTAGAVSSLAEGVNTPLALQGRAAFGHPLTPASGGNHYLYLFSVAHSTIGGWENLIYYFCKVTTEAQLIRDPK